MSDQYHFNNQNRYPNQHPGQGRQLPQQVNSRPASLSRVNNGPSEISQHVNSQQQHSSNTGNSKQTTQPFVEPRIEHVGYGKNAAFQFSSGKSRSGLHTVFMESAKRLNPNDPNNRDYNWQKKILLQLTASELPIVIAVLMGQLPSCEFKNHGPQNKWFSIENQGKNFYMKMGASQMEMNVAPISLVDALQFGTIALVSYIKNYPGLSSEAALTTIRMMSKQMYDNGSFPAVQAQRRQ
ncbi:hypothetical protein [Rheinheimera hassiensis]|uniref:hypothetical protein n=1 Tax=Rheinheimera hassiensis TaxID=1193627 RepID=UPI001F0507E9|nr:hypothetical protein [Rheinheimera hassiensis]